MEKGLFKKIKCFERPVTDLQFNRDGDLIFASSKSSTAVVLRNDGSALGSYNGHDGSIFSLSISSNSLNLITGSADQSIIQWDVESGGAIKKIDTDSVVKTTDNFEKTNIFVAISDRSMNKKRNVFIYDSRDKTIKNVYSPDFDSTGVIVDYSENYLIISDDEGYVYKFDMKNNRIIEKAKIHTSKINNINPSRCRTFFISSSMDAQAKIVDIENLKIKKTFVCEQPINCSAIFSSNDKVVSVGGVNARDVTTSKGKSTIDTSFFDIVTSEKIGHYTTHYGTINCVDVHPLNTMYCSAGEEGLISLVTFGSDFHNAKFTKFF